MNHGYDKLVHFSTYKPKFINFLGIGQGTSLCLAIFAEFFCALFIVLGLFTRLAAIPLIIGMCVALFKAHNGDFFGDGEMATLYLGAFLTLLLVGPGRASIDRRTTAYECTDFVCQLPVTSVEALGGGRG